MDSKMTPFPAGSASLASRSTGDTPRSTGNRRALCIGINEYPHPKDRLGGCVNDANSWASWFTTQGFCVELLLDGAATRQGMLNSIRNMIQDANAGDVIAIQYSGHGTQMPDQNGDEDDGQDEALVPYDHRTNGYIIDDDLGEICDKIPSGVNVNFFMDSCHSGSNTRMLFGRSTVAANERERFLRPDAEMLNAHRRSVSGVGSRSFQSRQSGLQQEILFSACQPHETAKERNGQGDFTRFALQVLKSQTGLTNARFVSEIHRVGTFNNQAPQLWARGSLHDLPLLSSRERSLDSAAGDGNESLTQILKETLLEIEDRLSSLRQRIS